MKRGALFSLVLGLAAVAVSAAAMTVWATGSGAVSGTVLTYNGLAQTGAWVEWGADDTHGIYAATGGALTNGSGAYSIGSVGATAGTGEVFMRPPGTTNYLNHFGLTFADPGTTTLDFRPGKLNFTTDRATSWNTWKGVRVVTFGSDAGGGTSAQTTIPGAGAGGTSGLVKAMPDNVTSAVASPPRSGARARRAAPSRPSSPIGRPRRRRTSTPHRVFPPAVRRHTSASCSPHWARKRRPSP
jgi:hypothetical protein